MDFKIIYSNSPDELNKKIKDLINEGYEPIGSHKVVEIHHQNKFSGSQHMSTFIQSEYSISMIKND